MCRLLFVAILLIAGPPVARASAAAFEHVYGDGSGAILGWDVRQMPDGGYAVLAQVAQGGGASQGWLLRTDDAGDSLWVATYGAPGEQLLPLKLELIEDGGFAIGATYNPTPGTPTTAQMRLLRTDSLGVEVWTWTSATNVRFGSMRRTEDGGYILVGRTGGSNCDDLYLSRIDVDGNEAWSKTHIACLTSRGMDIELGDDGGFVVVCTQNVAPGDDQLYFLGLDSAGEVLWTKEGGGGLADIASSLHRTLDGGYFATGFFETTSPGSLTVREKDTRLGLAPVAGPVPLYDIYVEQLSRDGVAVYDKRYGSADEGAFASSNDPSSGHLIAAYTDAASSPGVLDIQVLNVEADGDTAWGAIHGGAAYEQPGAIRPTSDGGYVVSGYSTSFNATQTLYLVKTAPRTYPLVVAIPSATVTDTVTFEVPIRYRGTEDLGVIALRVDYDPSELQFEGVHSHVDGEVFTVGLIGNQISIQWFDETAGADPIPAGTDTLLALKLRSIGNQFGLTTLQFDVAQSQLGDAAGAPIAGVTWHDDAPFGQVRLDLPIAISGRVGYYWLVHGVAGATLSIGGGVPDTQSDTTGYIFQPVPFGTYGTLDVTKSDDTGGINALDALKVVRHAAGLELFGHVHKETAADVTGGGTIDAFDAFEIVQAAIGASSLPSGDWVFDPPNRTIGLLTAHRLDQDFTAIRMGDVNGDWSPDPTGAPMARRPLSVGRNLLAGVAPTLSFPDTAGADTASSVDVPLAAQGFDGIGALSLRIGFDSDVLAFSGLTSNVPGVTLTSNLVGNELRIEWFDATGGSNPISIGDATLLTVTWSVIGSLGEASELTFLAPSALGDVVGDPVAGAGFIAGSYTIQPTVAVAPPPTPSALQLAPSVPNPFTTSTSLSFSVPRPAPVRLGVYDASGREMVRLVDGWREAGTYTITWLGRGRDGRQLPAGLYWARLTSGGQSTTRNLLIVR